MLVLLSYKSGAHLSQPSPLTFFSLLEARYLWVSSVIQDAVHQPIGSSCLYSSVLIYPTQCNATGNLLTSAICIHSDMFLLKSIPAKSFVDKCGKSITACAVNMTVLEMERSRQDWCIFVREILIVCQCFQIAAWCDTDCEWDHRSQCRSGVWPCSTGEVEKKTVMTDELSFFLCY